MGGRDKIKCIKTKGHTQTNGYEIPWSEFTPNPHWIITTLICGQAWEGGRSDDKLWQLPLQADLLPTHKQNPSLSTCSSLLRMGHYSFHILDTQSEQGKFGLLFTNHKFTWPTHVCSSTVSAQTHRKFCETTYQTTDTCSISQILTL